MIYTNDDYVLETLKKRETDAHKGDFGKVLIFAGSLGMAGAAVLQGNAALKTGSGLVRFLLPEMPNEIYQILQIGVPEATCVGYLEDMDFNEYDAISCGSGLGKSSKAKKIFMHILNDFGKGKTLVLDADALNMIAEDLSLAEAVKNSKADIIITPHIGEAKRLLNTCEGIRSISDRKNAACALAEKFNAVSVLKGAGTLVCALNKEGTSRFLIFENTTGNPGMATAGSGDTLSGIILSLAGQKYSPVDASRLGVFIHGKAGDLAKEELGEMSVTAGEIGKKIPAAIKSYYEKL